MRLGLCPGHISGRPISLLSKLKTHLAEEDKELYPSLLTHDDDKVRSTAWGFINGEHGLRQWSVAYNKKWLKDCKFEFTEEFLQETNELLDALAARVDREERFLFARLQEGTGEGKSDG